MEVSDYCHSETNLIRQVAEIMKVFKVAESLCFIANYISPFSNFIAKLL